MDRENSNIRSISAWISASELLDREFARSIRARFVGLLSRERLANEMSAVTRVMMILENINS
jgi:hypothetical protein